MLYCQVYLQNSFVSCMPAETLVQWCNVGVMHMYASFEAFIRSFQRVVGPSMTIFFDKRILHASVVLLGWAEDEGIRGQADFCKIDNFHVLKSLIDKQKQTHGKLYSCFVGFKKAFDTVPCGLLWQVLQTVGIRRPIIDCIKSLYSHDSADVKNQEGITDTFDCLMRVKQGCPPSAQLSLGYLWMA